MSFDQRSFDDKTGVNADSFSAQPSLQHMSRRCIMSLSVKATRIVGLASSGLFCTASACASVLNNAMAVEGNISLVILEEPHNRASVMMNFCVGGAAPCLCQRYSDQGMLLSTSVITPATLLASPLECPHGFA